MQFFERLTELPSGQMTKPEVIESSVGELRRHCRDYPPVCWRSFLAMAESWLSLVLAWACVWLELFAEGDTGYFEDYLVLACVEESFKCAASMNSGPFDARDYVFLCTDWRWWKPRVFFVHDSNY